MAYHRQYNEAVTLLLAKMQGIYMPPTPLSSSASAIAKGIR
jgi:hypothetical protein